MAEKKKQHYVPRFYLKLFSWGDKKAINIYNIRSQKPIWGGSLKDQCYETYFYGKDLVFENAFGDLESAASRVINQIIRRKSAQEQSTQEHRTILTHALLQRARTKYAAEADEEMGDTLIKTIMGEGGTLIREEPDQAEIKNDNPTALPLATMALIIPVAMDLMYKVLVNKTSLSFITSDCPVVLYNRACEQSKVMSHIGLASKGLEIIFPLSPKHILLFYDERIYKVGARKQRFAYVNVENDVRQFNDLQWLNAHENIYFNDRSLYPEILRGASKNIKKRHTKKAYINKYQGDTRADGMQSTLLHVHRSVLNIGMNIHCIKQIRVVSEEEMNNGAKSIRNPGLYNIYSEFLVLVHKGEYKPSEFGEFLHDKQKQKTP